MRPSKTFWLCQGQPPIFYWPVQTLGAVGQQSQHQVERFLAWLGHALRQQACMLVHGLTIASYLPWLCHGYVKRTHSNCLPRHLHVIMLASAHRSATTVLDSVIERHGDSCIGSVIQRALFETMGWPTGQCCNSNFAGPHTFAITV